MARVSPQPWVATAAVTGLSPPTSRSVRPAWCVPLKLTSGLRLKGLAEEGLGEEREPVQEEGRGRR